VKPLTIKPLKGLDNGFIRQFANAFTIAGEMNSMSFDNSGPCAEIMPHVHIAV
jgi:hypothetical protein